MKRGPHSMASSPGATPAEPGFKEDLLDVLRPARRWHRVFHLLVLLVAASYWVGSLLKLPEASWAEIVMYRPKGDNQVYPVITALSRLNFGDPTDAVQYGKGVAGFHAVVLLPHALAVRVFGWPGYLVADLAYYWAYFVAVTMLLRRVGLGPLGSLLLASALATGSLQNLAGKVGQALFKVVGTFEVGLSDWHFPNLVALTVFDTRIPRPLVTELFVVLLLYFLWRAWRAGGPLDGRLGLALGVLMGLLAQGDPYLFSALGLVLAAVVVRGVAARSWKVPWRFGLALGAGMLGVGAYFIFQVFAQHPEAAVRFGLAEFPRTRLMPLPGYGPLLRVGVIGLLAGVILWAARRRTPRAADEPGAAGAGLEPVPGRAREVARFCVVLVVAGWLAQPVQLFLLGQGAQIYHYLSFTLPTLYSYALLFLLVQFALGASAWFAPGAGGAAGPAPRWACGTLVGCLLGGQVLLGIELSLDAMRNPLTAREESTPWSEVGARYRGAFRSLDKALRELPALREARTFASFSHEVNFLLAGFHDKRAFLPDNGFTTLPDAVLEHRLFEVAKICQLHPDRFAGFVQNHVILNYWLGCAKYWFATDHTFTALTNYADTQVREFHKMGRQAPFSLALPPSEVQRLVSAYATVAFQESDVSTYPDLVVITSTLRQQGVVPHPVVYAETYTNDVFSAYVRKFRDGVFSAGPPPPVPGQ